MRKVGFSSLWTVIDILLYQNRNKEILQVILVEAVLFIPFTSTTKKI